MTSIAPEDFRFLQAAGLLTMALIIGVRLVPAFHAYTTRVQVAAFTLYVAAGIGIFVWRQL